MAIKLRPWNDNRDNKSNQYKGKNLRLTYRILKLEL